MKKILLPYLLCILVFGIRAQEFPREPWGPWTTHPLNKEVAVVRVYKTEKFYQHGHAGIWIFEDYSYEDEIFTAFVEDGGFIKIEKYEQTDYGYLFYLVDEGFRYNPLNENPPLFKREMRMQVKMIFIDRDTCKFEFIGYYDEEGYRFNTFIRENVPYHRYRVEDE